MTSFELFLEMWNKSNKDLRLKARELKIKNQEITMKLRDPKHKVKKTDWYHHNKRQKIISSIGKELSNRTSKIPLGPVSKK